MKNHYALYGRDWYLKNKEYNLERGREWDKANRKKRVKISQNYTKRNKDKVSTYNKEFSLSVEGKYRLLKYRHIKRKWVDEFINFESFIEIISNPCVYCGEPCNKGIDRVDNSKGYSIENSVPCCKICNMMKKAMDKDEFILHIKKICNQNQK